MKQPRKKYQTRNGKWTVRRKAKAFADQFLLDTNPPITADTVRTLMRLAYITGHESAMRSK